MFLVHNCGLSRTALGSPGSLLAAQGFEGTLEFERHLLFNRGGEVCLETAAFGSSGKMLNDCKLQLQCVKSIKRIRKMAEPQQSCPQGGCGPVRPVNNWRKAKPQSSGSTASSKDGDLESVIWSTRLAVSLNLSHPTHILQTPTYPQLKVWYRRHLFIYYETACSRVREMVEGKGLACGQSFCITFGFSCPSKRSSGSWTLTGVAQTHLQKRKKKKSDCSLQIHLLFPSTSFFSD